MAAHSRGVIYVWALVLAMAVVGGCSRAGEPSQPDPIPAGDYTYAGELAAHRVEALMEQHHMPGAAAALIDDQEVVWQGNFGLAEIASKTPVTADTIFKLWSLAKPITALEIMRLVEEGRVDLDAPISTYIPDFTIQSRFKIDHWLLRLGLARFLPLPAGLDKTVIAFQPASDLGDDVAIFDFGGMAYEIGVRYPDLPRYRRPGRV